jgi:hypothetical protein
MNIKEALVRQSKQDKVEIGTIIERAMKGKFGDIFYAVVEGLKKQELQESRIYPAKLSSDRVLGRMEGLDMLIDSIEIAIHEKDEILAPIRNDEQADE